MNNYQKTSLEFKEFILTELNYLLKKENYELPLMLGTVNMLKDSYSSVKSSTAVGYCIEEYFSTKLVENHPKLFNRVLGGTQGSSYDLFAKKNNINLLINFKASLMPNDGNSGIAAMTKLHSDYNESPDVEKLYAIIKFKYRILDNGSIFIEDIIMFYLEQISFSNIGQDKRNWSDTFNANSGRLQITNKVLKEQILPIEEIDYFSFKTSLNERFNSNSKK